MSKQRLLEIKEKIDNAKTQQSELKGKIAGVEDQIKTKFNVKTDKEIDQELKKRSAKLDQMEKQLEEGEVALESAYQWSN